MNVVIIGIAVIAALTWAAWWIRRRDKRHGKHRTPLGPSVAAHHPLPVVDTGPPTEAWALPTRHTTRDPATGRYTRREQK